jgi:hypothetical protein
VLRPGRLAGLLATSERPDGTPLHGHGLPDLVVGRLDRGHGCAPATAERGAWRRGLPDVTGRERAAVGPAEPLPAQGRRQLMAALCGAVPPLIVPLVRHRRSSSAASGADQARAAAPVAGLRGAGTGVVGPRPAGASVAVADPRSGRDGDLPGPARLPAAQLGSPPLACCQAPTNPPSRRAPPSRSRMAHAHRTPGRWRLPDKVWVRLPTRRRRPARRRPRFPARTSG